MRRGVLVLAAALSLLGLAGCGGGAREAAPAASATCPEAWRPAWQQLADQVRAAVYCPSWMPNPLDGKIGGAYANGRYVDRKDHSYLVSFVWVDRDIGGITGEAHVNFRGYPGRASIPMCQTTLTAAGKTVHRPAPCFSDARGRRRFGSITATVYTANQGADEWHVLYAWRRSGSLYAVSEHVAAPRSFKRVLQDLDRITRSLALIEPSA